MSDIIKLLDNGWNIQLFRSVDKRYTAVVRRAYRDSWRDVMGEIGEEYARPHNIATGDTPSEAMELVARQVLGLGE